MNTSGQRIKYFRDKAHDGDGMTQEELSKECGIPLGTLANYEANIKKKNINPKQLKKIAFSLDIDWRILDPDITPEFDEVKNKTKPSNHVHTDCEHICEKLTPWEKNLLKKYANIADDEREKVYEGFKRLVNDTEEKHALPDDAQKKSAAEMNMLTLSKFCEWCKSRRIALTSKLSASVANSYMDGMEVGPKTHNNTKITLSAIWRAIGEENIWQEIKSRPLKTNPMRGFTENEITAIFERVAFDPFWRPACYLALFTGLRLTDIVHLRRSQIHKNHSYLELRPSKTERTGRSVYIPIHPTLKKELQAIKTKGDHLFPEAVHNYDNSRHMIIKQFSRTLDALGIDNTDSGRAGFHSWRVTFASRARENGISAETIRAVLGHTTKAMTAHYTDTPEALSLDSMPDVKIS